MVITTYMAHNIIILLIYIKWIGGENVVLVVMAHKHVHSKQAINVIKIQTSHIPGLSLDYMPTLLLTYEIHHIAFDLSLYRVNEI